MIPSRALLLVLLVVVVVAMAMTARADTLWIGGAAGGGGGIEMKGVQVQEVREGKILFVGAGGAGTGGARDVKQIARIMADNEPALNAGEAALAKNQLDVATENYRKALASSGKEWVKVWAAQRLTQAAPRANRFDAAASGYIFLLVRDSGGAGRAAEFKPASLPPAQSTFLTTAINEASVALTTPNLAPAAKEALSAFISELQQAKTGAGAAAAPGGASPAAAPSTAGQPNATTTGQPATATAGAGATGAAAQAPQSVAAAAADAAGAAANQKLARQKLDAANAALERKDYPAAINEIRANGKIFTEARDQAQALYFLAEAQTGIARAKNDVPSWQDAALAYMRVVAHFHAPPSPATAPFVARSMLKAAQIQETLRDPAAARALYEQLTREFPADPAAKDAAAALARLQSKS